MKYFALMYDVVDGFVEKRLPHRPAHLQMIHDAQARGEIVMAGALGEPPDGALIVFRAEGPDVVERFAKADPYVTSGLVRNWRVRPWAVVTK